MLKPNIKKGKENNFTNPITNESKPIKISNMKPEPVSSRPIEKPNQLGNITTNIPNTTKNSSNPLATSLKNEPISILSLLGSQNYVPLDINNLNLIFNKYDEPKVSSKNLTDIRAYAANTNQGIVR